MKRWWKRHRHKFFAIIGYPLVKGLMMTTRITQLHRERWTGLQTSSILCGLHARGLAAAYIWSKQKVWVLVSLSRDGQLQNKIYTQFGYQTVRGSTGREGIKATVEAIRLLRSGKESMIIAVDGPRGPRGIVQGGAILMAKKSGCALMPVGVSAKPRKTVRSWDKFMVPLPFCRVVAVYGEPIYVPANADDAEMERCRQALQDAIHACEDEADAAVGYTPEPGERIEPCA